MHAAVPLADVSLSCYTLVDITRARQGFLMSTPHAVVPYQTTILPCPRPAPTMIRNLAPGPGWGEEVLPMEIIVVRAVNGYQSYRG